MKMGKTTIPLLIFFTAIIVIIPMEYCQGADPHTSEKLFYERAKLLEQNIEEGWSMGEVQAIMGEPERRQSVTNGSEVDEIWGYRGYDVRIEFRNGLVSKWYFRFMPARGGRK